MNNLIKCENCGALIMSKSSNCPTCGAAVKKQKRKVPSIILIVMLMVVLYLAYEYSVFAREDNPNVNAVKYASPIDYPDVTFLDAFNGFFSSPSWRYFEGTKGNSDQVFDIVEFTGGCVYAGSQVTAKIQFTLDNESGTFIPSYLSINDVPMDYDNLNGLLDTVFSSYSESQILLSNKATPVQ